MSKYLTVFLSLICCISTCDAVTIDGTDMLDGNIQDTFIKIRDRVQLHESDEEVFKMIIKDRIEPNILSSNGIDRTFTTDDIYKFINGEFIDKEDFSARDIKLKTMDAFQNRFNFEKDIWDFEQDLLQIIQILPRNMNEIDTDDLFDHIRNWNDLDEMLFGEKYHKTEALFGEKTESFSEEEDKKGKKWQVGDIRQRNKSDSFIKTTTEKTAFTYKQEDLSIASQIYHIKEKLKYLNTKQLLSEKNTTKFYEFPLLPPYKTRKNSVLTQLLPQIKKIDREQIELESVKFKGIENQLLENNECEKIVIPPIGISNEFKNLFVRNCEALRAETFALEMEGLEKMGNLKPYIDNGYRIGAILTFMDDHFWTFYLEVSEMRKYLEDIAGDQTKD